MHSAICYAIQCMSLRVRYCHRLRDACLQGIQEREKKEMICIALHYIPSHHITLHITHYTLHIYTLYI